MASILELQRALLARGYDLGKSRDDGIIGPKTIDAALDAVLKLPYEAPKPTPPATILNPIPADWLPWCHMLRIIVHWTAGTNIASADDRDHYHILMNGDTKLVRGNKTIADNMSTKDGVYAAHTFNLNTQSIGVSLCGMRGAQESPFVAGPSPLTEAQWNALPHVLAQLCRRFSIPVTRQTVLSHAEVQPTLGIKQKGKWDITRLPFNPQLKGAIAIGDEFRKATQALL